MFDSVPHNHKFIAEAKTPDDLNQRVWRLAFSLGICIDSHEDYFSQAAHCRRIGATEMACYLETAARCSMRLGRIL